MNTAYIYALRDPRNGRVFYVGKTTMPWRRLKSHMRTDMCKDLVESGFSPMIQILERTDDWREREVFWIAEFKRLGSVLHNRHRGGNSRDSGFTQPISDATKKRISETLKGRPLHPAFLERQKNVDPVHLKKMTERAVVATKGRHWSEEMKKRISESNKATWAAKFKSDPDALAQSRINGKRVAKKQWSDMSDDRRKEVVNRMHEWFRKLSPEEQSERQRQYAIKPRKRVSHDV